MDKKKTVSFTGYRPKKLPYYGNEETQEIQNLKTKLYDAIIQSIKDGYDTFLVGMAEGFDTFSAEAVIEAKKM